MGGQVGAALQRAAHMEALRSTVAASLRGGVSVAAKKLEVPRPSLWGRLFGSAIASRAVSLQAERYSGDQTADVISYRSGRSGGMGVSDDFDCSKVGKCAVVVENHTGDASNGSENLRGQRPEASALPLTAVSSKLFCRNCRPSHQGQCLTPENHAKALVDFSTFHCHLHITHNRGPHVWDAT